MRAPAHYLRVLRAQPRPLSFLMARALARSGASTLIRMDWHGFSLRFYPTNLSSHIFVDRNARWADSAFLRDWLSPGDVMVDVGANIGTTVLPAARAVGPDGLVIAVEANPRLVRYLLGNLAENAVTNVDVRWCAVGDRSGEVTLADSLADDRNGVTNAGDGLSVPLRTLDDVTSALRRVDLLKLDVEGYEKFVLLGAEETLRRTSCVLFESAEQHARGWGYSTADVIALLRERGFRIFRLSGPRRLSPVDGDYTSKRCEDLVALRTSVAPRAGFTVAND